MTYLFIFILILALMQPSGNRRAACCVFAGSILAVDYICEYAKIPAEDYFFIDALNMAVCFILLGKLKPMPFVAYVLQRFCAVSIFLNFTGYALYKNYLPPAPYVISFQVFHFLLILLFIYGGPVYGHFKRNQHDRGFYLSHDMGGYIYRETTF